MNLPVSRRCFFRIAAVCLGCGLFVCLELVCIILGWGVRDLNEDPFVEFSSVRPLFQQTPDGTSYLTAPNRRRYFKEDSFAAQKPPDEFRVFVFGGSTVQGNPFSIETSFPSFLQIALTTANPERRWKVVNCGGVSYSSYRLLPVMQECLSYEPDLFIFCEGHNEFLEHVAYSESQKTPAVLQVAFDVLNKFRSFRVLRRVLLSDQFPWVGSNTVLRDASSETAGQRPLLPEDVDTLLDHDGGLEAYHRNDEHSSKVVEHFRFNLERMAAMCRDRGLPFLVILPPSNLSDCPPFKAEFSADLPEEDRKQIAQTLLTARSFPLEHLDRAIEQAHTATRLDPRYALAWYELAHFQLAARQFEEAERSFRRARDEDVCPLRMTTDLEEAMKNVVDSYQLPFLNAHELLSANCRNRIVGENVLVDHVHPSFRGHEDIAIEIADWMMSAGYAKPTTEDWLAATRAECRTRLQSLDNLYFLRGKRALENLRLWAAGRSGGPPLKPR